MEAFEILNKHIMLRSELKGLVKLAKKTGDNLEFEGDLDMASIYYIDRTGYYVFILNALPIFSLKTLDSFIDNALEYINERDLIQVIE